MRFILLIALVWPTFAQEARRDDRVRALEHAATLIQHAELTEAESVLKPFVSEPSDDAVALNLMGLIRMQQGNGAEAEKFFERATATGRKVVGPYVNLAMLRATDQPLDALKDLQTALAIAPTNGQARELVRKIARESTARALSNHNKDEAVAIAVEARRILPEDPEILYDFGMVGFEAELYKDAQAALEEALRGRQDYAEAHYALARVYLNQGLAQQAEQEMRRYLVLRPQDASAEYGLGYVLMAEQKLDEAKQAFEESLKLQPQQTESLFQLGEIAMEHGETEAAHGFFVRVVSSDAHHGGALTELGVIAFKSAKYDEAKGDLQQAVAAAPNYQKAHYYYALTLSKMGEKERAAGEFALAKQLQQKQLESVRVNLPPQ